MSFVSVLVDQEVVDVDDYILEVQEYAFHESLKRGWASRQSSSGDVTQWNWPFPGIVKAVSG